MTIARELAAFVVGASYDSLTESAREQLQIRILDSVACAAGALEGEPVRRIREHLDEHGGRGRAQLIGGGSTSPDRAALYNGALVRYLDFNDSYLASGETCHPSDNLGAVLAAAEHAGASGKDLLAALAVAYQVQCRLSDVAPVRAAGFDHTTQGSYAVAAGVSKALGLDEERTANAVAIAGTAFNALRVTRTGTLSNWKGLAYPNTAFCCTHAALLASRGITGPPEVFEGNKGFMDAISGKFEIDWSREGLDRVERTIVKKYNAEIHSQSAVEGILELKKEHGIDGRDVERVEVETFDVAYNIIGGGEEGAKTDVATKEEADHSLPYILAVALLDGDVMPEQYRPERIRAADVTDLVKRVDVSPREDFSRRFPDEMPCALRVVLRDGRELTKEKKDYEGFHTRPAAGDTVVRKLERLGGASTTRALREHIVDTVGDLDQRPASDLADLLARVGEPTRKESSE